MAARPTAADLERFRSVSPIAHVEKVTAPLLFLLGAKDRRCDQYIILDICKPCSSLISHVAAVPGGAKDRRCCHCTGESVIRSPSLSAVTSPAAAGLCGADNRSQRSFDSVPLDVVSNRHLQVPYAILPSQSLVGVHCRVPLTDAQLYVRALRARGASAPESRTIVFPEDTHALDR